MNVTLSSVLAGVLTLAILSCGISCGKTGPQGQTGAVGPVGPAGNNGSQIYSGSGMPAATLGATGDYYLDLSTGNLYGPKTTGGWGSPLLLKGDTGATGATGAAGSQIYSGTTLPAPTLGNVGDYYLDKTTFMLYGPKTGTGWGVPVLLQGPQGPMGNANVKVDTFTLTSAQWIWGSVYYFSPQAGTNYNFLTRYYDAAFPALTRGILDSGMVLVYFTSDPNHDADQWVPLPFSFLEIVDNFYFNLAYETNLGAVRLHFFLTPMRPLGTVPALSTYPIATYKFKLVAVSGTIAGAMEQQGIDTRDYGAVNRFLLTSHAASPAPRDSAS